MTKLETIVSEGHFLPGGHEQPHLQNQLDQFAPYILTQIAPVDLVNHNADVYSATMEEYEKNKHNKDIIDELIPFMDMLPNSSRVLDVGCATGRDSLFMSISDEEFRSSLMERLKNGSKTKDKFPVPTKRFKVTGIDNSSSMLGRADEKTRSVIEKGLLTHPDSPLFHYEDMHNIDPQTFGDFDGVWSCTSLFTHTPFAYLELAMESVARVLKSGGVFFASYTNGLADYGRYDKLLLSRTGRIKYFSQPDPDMIKRIAEKHGMILFSQTFGDFVTDVVVKKDLFVSQFFRKS